MLNVNFHPFPQIITDRLVLRQMTETDKAAVFEFRSDPTAMQFIPRDLAVGVNDALAKIHKANDMIAGNGGIVWGITRKGEDTVIGTILIFNIKHDARRAEIGYMLSTRYHRQGIMHEALAACINYGFETMNLHSIEAIVMADNAASAALLVKTGFVKEGHFIENQFFRGAFYNSVLYSLLKRNWIK